jgi:hypothetical protein
MFYYKGVCGFKVHVVTDMRGKKVVNFCFSNVASHDAKRLAGQFRVRHKRSIPKIIRKSSEGILARRFRV